MADVHVETEVEQLRERVGPSLRKRTGRHHTSGMGLESATTPGKHRRCDVSVPAVERKGTLDTVVLAPAPDGPIAVAQARLPRSSVASTSGGSDVRSVRTGESPSHDGADAMQDLIPCCAVDPARGCRGGTWST